jgi:hypothetical protein
MLRYALVVSSLIGAILLAVPQVMSQGTVEGIRLDMHADRRDD